MYYNDMYGIVYITFTLKFNDERESITTVHML